MKPKKTTKKMLLNYYRKEDLRNFMKISNYQALNWLEEVNRFFYKLNPKKWEKDHEMMKKIGW
jgi:hypothetical protein